MPDAQKTSTRSLRESADYLLALAGASAPQKGAVADTLAADATSEEAVRRGVDRLLRNSRAVMSRTGTAGRGRGREAGGQAIAVLLFDLEVSRAMLAAGEAPSAEKTARASESDGADEAWAGSAERLDALETWIDDPALLVDRTPELTPRGLTQGATEPGATLDKLQSAGADELLALATSALAANATGAALHAVGELAGPAVRGALDSARKALSKGLAWLKRGALQIITWVLGKFASTLSAEDASAVDSLARALEAKLKAGAKAGFSEALGDALGRHGVENAWASASSTAAALSLLEPVAHSHLVRIGYVSTARGAAETALAVVAGVLAVAPATVQILAGALVLSVVAFVGYQVFDGFRDIKALVTPVA